MTHRTPSAGRPAMRPPAVVDETLDTLGSRIELLTKEVDRMAKEWKEFKDEQKKMNGELVAIKLLLIERLPEGPPTPRVPSMPPSDE